MYKILDDKPINPDIRELTATVIKVGSRLGYRCLLVGAMARDILMRHIFGNEPRRATLDVDFAVAVKDWESFEQLKNALLDTGDFSASKERNHLLYYKLPENGTAYPLDIIPFGGVECAGHQITWPPEMNIVMNVTGYAEALESALEIDFGDGVLVPVVSIPALAALKLLAWDERGLVDNKDAQDLLFLLRRFHDAGNNDRLFDAEYDLLESHGFDLELAGAALLGRDTRAVLHPSSRECIIAVLADPRKRDRLIIHMTGSTGVQADAAARLLEAFEHGLVLNHCTPPA